jgi:hypothetical protein
MVVGRLTRQFKLRQSSLILSFQEGLMAEAPLNKLIIWTTLPRVIRKQHNVGIEHFIAIDPLVEVASVNE